MQEDINALLALLEEERDAAIRADIDALADLQPKKQTIVDRLAQANPPRPMMVAIREMVTTNTALIHQLVSCLRGILLGTAQPPDTYDAVGARVATEPGGQRRGAL